MPKLLLADDSVTIQRVIELTFADENVQVIAVGDGQEAIERIKADRPDIVLADIGMPERDGYEVASFVKGTPEYAHIPVLLLTGAFEPVDEARARAVGSDGVLVKPFEPQMVITRVRELLGKKADSAPPATSNPGPGSEPAWLSPASPSPALSGPTIIPSELDQLEPGPPGGGSRDALEDYFDRLDAALANMGTVPPPALEDEPVPFDLPSIGQLTDEESDTPEIVLNSGRTLTPTPAAPTAVAPAPPAPARAAAPSLVAEAPAPPPAPTPLRAVSPPPVAMPAPASSSTPTALHEAFAALLSAEQSRPIAPAAGQLMSDEDLESIVQQVVTRLKDDEMRRLVLDAAERLVREEIDRIKSFR